MGKKNFVNVIDNNGDTVPMVLKDKMVCGFADGRKVLIGESVEGTFAMELRNPDDSTRYPYQGVHLTEGSLMAFFGTICVYFHHKGINPHQLLQKYLPDGQDSVQCFFEEYNNEEKMDNKKTKIDELIVEAFKKKDKKMLEAYKNLKAELQKVLTAKNAPAYSEAVFVQVATKYCKTLEDAIQQFKDGGRQDLATEYENELKYLLPLIPTKATLSEIMVALYEWAGKHDCLEWVDPNNHNLFQTPKIPKKEMGAVMKFLKEKFPSTDGKYLSEQLAQFIVK